MGDQLTDIEIIQLMIFNNPSEIQPVKKVRKLRKLKREQCEICSVLYKRGKPFVHINSLTHHYLR